MKKKILVSSILFALFILLFVSPNTYATETGTINFKAIDSEGHEVNNLEVKIYKVARYENLKLIALDGFNEFDVESLSDENISKMQEYASEEVKDPLTKITNENGEFALSNAESRKILISSK